jgi:hypothetical protein
MRKRWILTILVLLAAAAGIWVFTRPSYEVSSVGILGRAQDDSAVIVFQDEHDQELTHISIGYPAREYFGPDAVYYTLDGTTYASVRYRDGKAGETLKGINGILLYAKAGDCCFWYGGGQLAAVKNGREMSLTTVSLQDYHVFDGVLYVFDGSRILTFDTADGTAGESITLPRGGYISMAQIGSVVYVVTGEGYVSLEGTALAVTYLYPRAVGEVLGCRWDYLAVLEDGATAVYQISFSETRMIMTAVYDEELLGDVDFSRRYPEYYTEGYEVLAYDDLRP